MRESQVEGGPSLESLGLSIKKTAEITAESPWQVKEKLRNGSYKAKKSGRRTIVIYQTVKAAFPRFSIFLPWPCDVLSI